VREDYPRSTSPTQWGLPAGVSVIVFGQFAREFGVGLAAVGGAVVIAG
jgi:hypothetical protein